MDDPLIVAALLGAAVGAILAGVLNIFGGLWASRREVLREARVELFLTEIQPMMDAVKRGDWDDDDDSIGPLLKRSWLLSKKERKMIREANVAVKALVQEKNAVLKDQKRSVLVERLRKVQRYSAQKIR